jgi:hypothetical protein
MDNFHDLQKSERPEERMSHDFLILLLDQLFGKHDQIKIDMNDENEKNHQIIKTQWRMINQYYNIPSSVKYNQKCVRQTIMQIVNHLNAKYQFAQPLKFEHKRHDYYHKEQKRKVTDYWTELNLI